MGFSSFILDPRTKKVALILCFLILLSILSVLPSSLVGPSSNVRAIYLPLFVNCFDGFPIPNIIFPSLSDSMFTEDDA